ncbi:hypothetical protein H8K52_03230 [Undibacterium seohonense]|uniref:Uncharacterized protein n=1 Tax=Undibacterium seohonense TaxID=1344950 RepID=A0ABR6X083_9BURK|nr:hypothetical protein [Undibacterium seohonense]MBC3806359.1 hypothetical protein [Undibacterium seohonense]
MKTFIYFCPLKLVIVSFIFVIGGTSVAKVSSQDEVPKPKTRKECVKMFKEKFSDPVDISAQASKELLQLIQDLETATDPDKRKLLEEKKKVEMVKFSENIDALANKLCDRLIK